MTTVLLDLEETVIDSWEDRNLLSANIEKIKPLVLPGDSFGIFSWAIWDSKDLENFNRTLRPALEEVLGVKFDDRFVFSMTMVSDAVFKLRQKWLSKEDMFDLFGKEECLFTMLRFGFFDDPTVVLVDDCAQHGLTIHTADDHMLIFANIDEMPNVPATSSK